MLDGDETNLYVRIQRLLTYAFLTGYVSPGNKVTFVKICKAPKGRHHEFREEANSCLRSDEAISGRIFALQELSLSIRVPGSVSVAHQTPAAGSDRAGCGHDVR